MSNVNNLQYVKTNDTYNEEAGNNMRITTLNARSVKNKDHLIAQQLHETDVDIAVITKTWLKDTGMTRLGSISQNSNNQTMTYYCRTDQVQEKGSSIALMYKCQYSNNIALLKKTITSTVEYLVWRLIHRNKALPHHRAISPPIQHWQPNNNPNIHW